MKKLKVLIAAIVAVNMFLPMTSSVSVFADTVNMGVKGNEKDEIKIKDENLKTVILETLLKDENYEITKEDMKTITEINAQDYGIQNIEGLEYCENLKVLNLKFNEITDLTSLAGLKNLKSLYASYNNISNLKPLKDLTNLEELTLSNNCIYNLSSLSYLKNLKLVSLAGQKIKLDIPAVQNNDGYYYIDNPVIDGNNSPVPVYKVSNGGKYIDYNAQSNKPNNVLKFRKLDGVTSVTFNFNSNVNIGSYSAEFSGSIINTLIKE